MPEAVVQRCSVKKVFLEISKNPQENTCDRVSFLIKLQASGLRSAPLLKKRLWHRCFPVDFTKFLRTPFFIEHLWWLLLACFMWLSRVRISSALLTYVPYCFFCHLCFAFKTTYIPSLLRVFVIFFITFVCFL